MAFNFSKIEFSRPAAQLNATRSQECHADPAASAHVEKRGHCFEIPQYSPAS
jgi:hypothetical protein